MILYSLSLAVWSRTLADNGRFAWRKWTIERRFVNGELPRLPVVGSVVDLGGYQAITCFAAYDRIGGHDVDDVWDPSLPVTAFYFTLLGGTPRWVSDARCYEGPMPAAELLERYEALHFSVRIESPAKNQEPAETPPPADT